MPPSHLPAFTCRQLICRPCWRCFLTISASISATSDSSHMLPILNSHLHAFSAFPSQCHAGGPVPEHLRRMRDFPRRPGRHSPPRPLCVEILLPAIVAAAVSALVASLLLPLRQNPPTRISSSDQFLTSRVSGSSSPAFHSRQSPVNPPEFPSQSLPRSIVMAPYNGKFAGELVVVEFCFPLVSSYVGIGLLAHAMRV